MGLTNPEGGRQGLQLFLGTPQMDAIIYFSFLACLQAWV
jgi:hypothetical protein